jgi:hypothetical protein
MCKLANSKMPCPRAAGKAFGDARPYKPLAGAVQMKYSVARLTAGVFAFGFGLLALGCIRLQLDACSL